MPYYCKHCDEFFRYHLVSGKICPTCGNEFFAYYKTKAISRRYAPVKARCEHCTLLGKSACPEDRAQIDPFYHKACEQFSPKKDAKYRLE